MCTHLWIINVHTYTLSKPPTRLAATPHRPLTKFPRNGYIPPPPKGGEMGKQTRQKSLPHRPCCCVVIWVELCGLKGERKLTASLHIDVGKGNGGGDMWVFFRNLTEIEASLRAVQRESCQCRPVCCCTKDRHER